MTGISEQTWQRNEVIVLSPDSGPQFELETANIGMATQIPFCEIPVTL